MSINNIIKYCENKSQGARPANKKRIHNNNEIKMSHSAMAQRIEKMRKKPQNFTEEEH